MLEIVDLLSEREPREQFTSAYRQVLRHEIEMSILAASNHRDAATPHQLTRLFVRQRRVLCGRLRGVVLRVKVDGSKWSWSSRSFTSARSMSSMFPSSSRMFGFEACSVYLHQRIATRQGQSFRRTAR